MTTHLVGRNPAPISRPSIIGGGVPLFNAEDSAIGSPDASNFLSSLQRGLQERGLAPSKLFGYAAETVPDWYRPDMAGPNAAAQADSWRQYVDGVNLGAFRGGTLGLLTGAAATLAILYFGGLMKSSPKPASTPSPAKPMGVLAAHSRHRFRKGRR